MARTKVVSGPNGQETIELTKEENAERDAEESEWADEANKRNVISAIKKLERQETPRRLAEAVLSDEGKAWLTANRDKIATERNKL